MLMKNASNEMLINRTTVTNNSRSKQEARGHRRRKFVFDLPHEKAIAAEWKEPETKTVEWERGEKSFMAETGMWKMLINSSWWCHIATGLQSGKDSDGSFDSGTENHDVNLKFLWMQASRLGVQSSLGKYFFFETARCCCIVDCLEVLSEGKTARVMQSSQILTN